MPILGMWLEKTAAEIKDLVAASKRIGGVVPTPFEGMGDRTFPTLHQVRLGIPGIGDQALSSGRRAKQYAQEIGSLGVQPGTIWHDPKVSRAFGGKLGPMLTTLHEGFERSARPLAGSMHVSPVVLMNEANLLQRATGAGAAGLRRMVAPLRKLEMGNLGEQMTSTFGPRASQFLQVGSRIPKAMKKALLRNYTALSPDTEQRIALRAGTILGNRLANV